MKLQQERKQARIIEAKSRERNDDLYQNERRLKTLRSDEANLPEHVKVDYMLMNTDDEKRAFISKWKKTCAKRKREQGPDDVQRKVQRRVKCKEELTLYPHRERTLDQVVDDLNNPDLQMEDAASVYTYKFKLHPTLAQRTLLRSYMGAYRYTYNELVSIYKDPERCQTIFGTKKPPSTQDAREAVMLKVNETPSLAWVKHVPYNLRELAPREYAAAVKVSRTLHPDNGFEMSYKSLKRDRVQTIPLGERCVFLSAAGVKIFPNVNKDVFQWKGTTAVKTLRALLDGPSTSSKNGTRPPMACKLVYDKGTRNYEIHIPMKRQQKWTRDITDAHTENQGCASVVALDPGVRTFLTGYSPDGTVTELASGDATRLCKLASAIDKVVSRIDNVDVRHHERQRLKRKRLRMHSRIGHLVSEMHWKTTNYLCSNYDVILLPSFGTQDMAKKVQKGHMRRKINRDTTRKMLMMSHYKFRLRLLHKARQWGKTVIIVNEAYTSKTCTSCGWQNPKLGGSKIFKCKKCNLSVGRDINGARNVLLRNTCSNM